MDDVAGNLGLDLLEVLFVHEGPVLLETEHAQSRAIHTGAGPPARCRHSHDHLKLLEEGAYGGLDLSG